MKKLYTTACIDKCHQPNEFEEANVSEKIIFSLSDLIKIELNDFTIVKAITLFWVQNCSLKIYILNA